MPSQPKTPQRAVRVDGRLWQAAQTRASKRGETVSDVIRAALVDYVRMGSYCASCFRTSDRLSEDGTCPEHGTEYLALGVLA